MVNIKRDMLIEMNWIRKTGTTVTRKDIKFNTLENEISKWLENLKKVFGIISKRELSSRRNKVNYEIILKTKKIKLSLLIFIQLEKQKIVKEYLNKITKKEWSRISKSSIVTFLFLIFKSETDKKRLVIDYKKLNKKIVTDSTSLLLIENMIN